MEIPVEIIAFHGWGFDSDMWKPFRDRLPSAVSFKTTDSGYFGNEQKATFNAGAKTPVLISHSYGLHKVPEQLFLEAEYIVVINGFRSFSVQNGNRDRVIDRMIRAFKRDPRSTLMEFYRNCGIRKEEVMPLESMQSKPLLHDLEKMKSSVFEVPKSMCGSWIFIDSTDDRIIPGARGYELHKLVAHSEHKFIESNDHVIPFTKSEECIRILYESIPIFRQL